MDVNIDVIVSRFENLFSREEIMGCLEKVSSEYNISMEKIISVTDRHFSRQKLVKRYGDLEQEFQRKETTFKILSYLSSYTSTRKGRTEVKNILERFLLNSASTCPPDKVYFHTKKSSFLFQNMKRELKEKKIDVDFSEVMKKIRIMIKTYLNKTFSDNADVRKFKETFKYRNFNFRLSRRRFFVLRKRSDYDIMKMILRYASIISTSQQWNLPLCWYRAIENNFGIDIEGFASPLNSQTILISPEKKFCSLFYDTDKPFGSIGNIFDLTHRQLQGKIMVNNPPYIIEIMERLVDKQEEWLSKTQLTIFMTVAGWEDAEYLDKAKKSKYLIDFKKFEPGKHFYETEKKGQVIKIIASFSTYVFYFSSKDTTFPDKFKQVNKTLIHN